MGWTRLDNPKPSKSALGRDNVRIAARAAMKGSRFIVVKIGAGVAQRASFTKAEHQCHLLLGGGEDVGNLAIALDDASGKFTAKRRADGHYQLTIGAAAAEGKFNLTFPPFERLAPLVPASSGPPFITVACVREFMSNGGK